MNNYNSKNYISYESSNRFTHIDIQKPNKLIVDQTHLPVKLNTLI